MGALVVGGRALTDAQAQRYRRGRRMMRVANVFRDDPLMNDGRLLLRVLASELLHENAADENIGRIRETIAIRTRMGFEVGSSGRAARVYAGLDLAFENGQLDGAEISAANLRKTGELYRACYEAANSLLTPASNEVRGSGGGGGVLEHTVECGLTLARLRARQRPKAIPFLDYVCGLDITVNATAIALRVDPRTVAKHLRAGLVIANENEAKR